MSENIETESTEALEYDNPVADSPDTMEQIPSTKPYAIGLIVSFLATAGIPSFIVIQAFSEVIRFNFLWFALMLSIIIVGSVICGTLDEKIRILENNDDSDQKHHDDNITNIVESRVMDDWSAYVVLHKELKDKVYHAETDWDTIFHYPSINDYSVIETQDLMTALSIAQRTNATPPDNVNDVDNIADLAYPKSVLALERAWNIAWQKAQKDRQKNLTVEERKTIERIMNLLNKVQDGAATDSEKQIAYQRIDTLLDSLNTITVPARAKELLAKEQQQALNDRMVKTYDSESSGITVSDMLNVQENDISALQAQHEQVKS